VPETWVLGSRHARANNSVRWEPPFPNFSKADILIINTGTLGTALLKDPTLKNALFDEASRSIFDMLMMAKKEIIAIMPLTATELSWLPVHPDCGYGAPTKTGRNPNSAIINRYLENVEAVSYYFRNMSFAFASKTNPNSSKWYQNCYSTELRQTFTIENEAKQTVGGSYTLDIAHTNTYLGSLIHEEHFVSSPMLFLPPPTKVSIQTGIDLLIGMMTGKTQ
jgi:hypothetical protein